ncbi:MAG: NADP-dependent isocitrate dehydrogenase, partial [Verrucomicrobiota bacterium]
AERITNAWLTTLEDGIHTGDVANETTTRQRVGTREFAEAVIERLGREPAQLAKADFGTGDARIVIPDLPVTQPKAKTLLGVDVFLHWAEDGRDPEILGKKLEKLAQPEFRLSMITNRGVKIYPSGFPETFCTDHWRCRFIATDSEGTVTHQDILHLLGRIADAHLDFIKTEHLCAFDGQRAYSLGQGE